MRWFKYGLILFVLTAVFVGGLWFATPKTKAETASNRLTIALENDIQTLVPVYLTDPYTSRIIWQIYEGLIGLDANGDLIPLLAESWKSSDDYKLWQFKIRKGVYFHKSASFAAPNHARQVSAHDVEYSYTRFAGALGSFIFSGLVEGFDEYTAKKEDHITGFRAVDDFTFEIRLTRPEPGFIYRLSSPFLSIMPKEAVDLGPEKFGKTIAVGTGPFRLVSRSDTRVELTRNPDYWKPTRGNVEQIVFRVAKNPQLRLAEFENGNLDLMLLPTSQIPRFLGKDKALLQKYRDKFVVAFQPTYNIHFIGINNKLIPDSHLRRAIAMAIDPDPIISQVLSGAAIKAASPVLPGMRGYTPPEFLKTDLGKAKSELEKSNYSGKPLKLLIHDAAGSELIGQIVQSQLSKIGLKIELEKVNFNTAMSRVFSGETPDMFSMFFEWIYSAPELLFDVYRSSKIPSPNVAAYQNEKADKLIDSAIAESRREKTNSLLYEAEKEINEDPPYIWLYHLQNVLIFKKSVSDMAINPNNHWLLSDARIKPF